MSLQKIKQAIADKRMKCPGCKGAIQKFDKYTEMTDSVWDGAGDCDSHMENSGASKVTLICGNCDWKERTEYWNNYLEES